MVGAMPDDGQVYEGVLNKTWAPYRLTATSKLAAPSRIDTGFYYSGPNFGSAAKTLMRDLASIDVVLTNDKSKWSRCVILEMCEDSSLSYNSTGGIVAKKARKLDFRRALSVD